MKLVIDIDEELYKNVVEHTKVGYVGSDVWIAVANGIALPEGHGDLIDRDELKTQLPTPIEDEYKTVYRIVDSMPSVIEADQERCCELKEIRWTDKVYLDSQGNIRSLDSCPTDQMTQELINQINTNIGCCQYHLSCPDCGETWWDNDAFPERCPKCGKERWNR